MLRDPLSGEALPARSPLPPTRDDLAKRIGEVKGASPVPVAGVASDGRGSTREAVGKAPDGVPHQPRQFHRLRGAVEPTYEADRHAEVQLEEEVRGIRPIERKVEGRRDDDAEAIRGYWAAVRSALTDDGRPPPGASGLKLQGRLTAVAASPDRVAVRSGPRRS